MSKKNTNNIIFIPGMSGIDSDLRIELEKYSKENNFNLHVFEGWKSSSDLQEKSFKEIKESFNKFYSDIRRENHKSLSNEKGLGGAKYYLIAKSFGGMFSLLYDLFDFEKNVLWAPAGGLSDFSNLRKIENLQLKNILNIDDVKIGIKNLNKIKNKTKKVSIIVGTKDEVIKIENQKITSENIQKCKYIEIENMGHSPKSESEIKELLDKTFEFLSEEKVEKKNKNQSIDSEIGEFENYPGQIEDFIKECVAEVKKGGRVLCTTLTKRMAEDLSNFLKDRKIKAEYMHSDVKTLERIQILTKFRRGEFDCLVGVNLLREGLDLPEVSLIGILDADKEGFLRSETSLIQTIGRAARNVDGRVILYADVMTGSMEKAINETNRRRKIQEEYNAKNNITPKTILKSINDITKGMESMHKKAAESALDTEIKLGGKKTIYSFKSKRKRNENGRKRSRL